MHSNAHPAPNGAFCSKSKIFVGIYSDNRMNCFRQNSGIR